MLCGLPTSSPAETTTTQSAATRTFYPYHFSTDRSAGRSSLTAEISMVTAEKLVDCAHDVATTLLNVPPNTFPDLAP